MMADWLSHWLTDNGNLLISSPHRQSENSLNILLPECFEIEACKKRRQFNIWEMNNLLQSAASHHVIHRFRRKDHGLGVALFSQSSGQSVSLALMWFARQSLIQSTNYSTHMYFFLVIAEAASESDFYWTRWSGIYPLSSSSQFTSHSASHQHRQPISES